MLIPVSIRLANNSKLAVSIAQTGTSATHVIHVEGDDSKRAVILAFRSAWSAGLSAAITAAQANPASITNDAMCRAFAAAFIEALSNTDIDTVLRPFTQGIPRSEFPSADAFLSTSDAFRMPMVGGTSGYLCGTRGAMISNMAAMIRCIASCQNAMNIRAYPKSRFAGARSFTAFSNALIKSVKPISEWVSRAASNWDQSMGGHSLEPETMDDVLRQCTTSESIIRNPIGIAIEAAGSNIIMALDLLARYVDIMTDGDPCISATNGMNATFSITHNTSSDQVLVPSSRTLEQLFGLNPVSNKYVPSVSHGNSSYTISSVFDGACIATRFIEGADLRVYVSDAYKYGWNVNFVMRAWSAFASHLFLGLTPKERESTRAEVARKRLAQLGLDDETINDIVECVTDDQIYNVDFVNEFLRKNRDHYKCSACSNVFPRGFSVSTHNQMTEAVPDVINFVGANFTRSANSEMFTYVNTPPAMEENTSAHAGVCTYCSNSAMDNSVARRKYRMRDQFIGSVITLKMTNGEVDPEIKFYMSTNPMYFGDREGSASNARSRGVSDGCAKYNSIIRGIDDSRFMVTSHMLNPTVSSSEDPSISAMRIGTNQVIACDKSLTDDQIEACLVRLFGDAHSVHNYRASNTTSGTYGSIRLINVSGHTFGVFRDRRGRIAALSIQSRYSILVVRDRDEDPVMESAANRSRFFLVDGTYYSNIDASPNAPSIYLSHDQASDRFLDRAVGIEFETGTGFRTSGSSHKGEQFMQMMTDRGVSTQFASWAIKTDGSLSSTAVEIVSPPMKGHAIGEGIKAYFEVAKELRFAVENYAAGGHIHIESTDLFSAIHDAHRVAACSDFNRATARILGFGMSSMLGAAREFVSRRRRNHHYCSGNPGVRYSSNLLDALGINDSNTYFRDGITMGGLADSNGRHGMEIQNRQSVQGGGSMGGTVRNARNYTLEFRIWPSSSSAMRVMARAELSQKLVEWFYQIIRPAFGQVVSSGRTISAEDYERVMAQIGKLADLLPGAAGRISGIERVRRRKALVDQLTTLLGLSDECSKVLRSIHMQFFSPTYNTNTEGADRVPSGFQEEDPAMELHNDTGVSHGNDDRGDIEAVYIDNIQ